MLLKMISSKYKYIKISMINPRESYEITMKYRNEIPSENYYMKKQANLMNEISRQKNEMSHQTSRHYTQWLTRQLPEFKH